MITQKFLKQYPAWAELRSKVDSELREEWEADFCDLVVTSTEITDSEIIINKTIHLDFDGDREDAEKFLLYLLTKPNS